MNSFLALMTSAPSPCNSLISCCPFILSLDFVSALIDLAQPAEMHKRDPDQVTATFSSPWPQVVVYFIQCLLQKVCLGLFCCTVVHPALAFTVCRFCSSLGQHWRCTHTPVHITAAYVGFSFSLSLSLFLFGHSCFDVLICCLYLSCATLKVPSSPVQLNAADLLGGSLLSC